jgi:hypothetical protein
MKEKSKLAGRKFRILRLLVIVQAYSAYRMMNLDREAISIENNWQDAERLQQSLSAIFPHSNTSIESFIYDKQELANEALQYYDKFKYWVHIAESVCITKTALTAFCKNVESGSSSYWLKCLGHLYYGDWLISLLLYLNREITKEQLHANLVEYSLFTGKSDPANMSRFRKDMAEIERVINEIHCKQLNREIKTVQIF